MNDQQRPLAEVIQSLFTGNGGPKVGYPKNIEEFTIGELQEEMERRKQFWRQGLCSYCHNPLKGSVAFKGVECRYHEGQDAGSETARRYKHG